MVKPADAAERRVRNVPRHAVVAEVRERMAQRRQFPVEHGNDPRLGGMKHEVVQAVVAVNDGHAQLVPGAGWNVCRQPFDELVHFRNRLRDGSDVLLAPSADLPVEIVAGFAVPREAALGKLDGVQGRDDAVHLVVNLAALGGSHPGQGLVPQHTPLHEFHHIERAANDRLVFAQAVHARHRDIGAPQAPHHRKLALDRVRGGQELGDRAGLGPHDVALCGRYELVSGVGLSALEHLYRERAGETFEVFFQPVRERSGIERVLVGDRAGADEMIVIAHTALLP